MSSESQPKYKIVDNGDGRRIRVITINGKPVDSVTLMPFLDGMLVEDDRPEEEIPRFKLNEYGKTKYA